MRWLRSGKQREKGPDQALEPVRILTPDLALDGFVAPAGQRITDILLRGQDLAFLPAGANPEPGNWVFIAPSDLLVVIPPPLQKRRDWREPVARAAASVVIGPYRVRGTAHLRPGERFQRPPAVPSSHRSRHPVGGRQDRAGGRGDRQPGQRGPVRPRRLTRAGSDLAAMLTACA
jgi:hypothetical protein